MEKVNVTEKTVIDGNIYKALIINAAKEIEACKEEVNALNVFPVPDGDTGSNMSMTVSNAAAELSKLSDASSISDSSSVTAKAMLYGARGNSGVILSLLFKGIANAYKGLDESDGEAFALALKSGVRSAFGAVEVPAKGTILTVSETCAERSVSAAKEKNSFEYVLGEVIKTGEIELAKTTEQNPVLKKANVIDAGAKGFILILKAMYEALGGEYKAGKTRSKKKVTAVEPAKDTSAPKKTHTGIAAFETDEIKYAFCTEFIIRKHDPEENTDKFKSFLSSIGDSLVFIDDDEIVKVHVHTNDSCLVLSAAQHYGVFETVKVENMRTQHTNKLVDMETAEAEQTLGESNSGVEASAVAEMPHYEKENGVVAVCSGEGITSIFNELGVDHIVSGGQTMNPSTEDILSAINSVDAATVYVLPNNKNIIMAANQAKELSDKTVFVIPTKSIPQGVTAMLNFNPELSGEENESNMRASIKEVDTIQLTHAAKNSDFDGYRIIQGDVLAIYNDKIIGHSVRPEKTWEKIARAALEAGKKIISIYFGSDSNEKEAEKCAKTFKKIIKDCSVDIIDGGQPVYNFLISAES